MIIEHGSHQGLMASYGSYASAVLYRKKITLHITFRIAAIFLFEPIMADRFAAVLGPALKTVALFRAKRGVTLRAHRRELQYCSSG